MAVTFNYNILNGFMEEWLMRKEELKSDKISHEEYLEWKLNWPYTSDDCGKRKPEHPWRKK